MSKMMKFVACVVVVATALGAARASPVRRGGPRTVKLAQALNKTVCPITVEVDEDADRIPRRIKLIKCAELPSRYCSAARVPHECCSRHAHRGARLACVQLTDTVLVYDRRAARTQPLHGVQVGCACMVQDVGAAAPAPADVDPRAT